MKLVMAAATPLSLDEIRVALCVVHGEPIWHPGKIVRDGTQLISLCGGNLLELDEEDGKVRFIHHSVIQHLLSPAESQNTAPYHFTAEAAENFIGATCVTYLYLPVLDSRITVTRSLQSLGMLDNVVGATREASPRVSLLVQHIRSREQRRARPSSFDIGHVLAQIQATRTQQDLDPRCFEPYATSNWVIHTRFFDENARYCKETWRLWWRLLNGGLATVTPPLACADLGEQPYPALLWAVENAHGSLFRHFFAILAKGVVGDQIFRDQMIEIVRLLEKHDSIHGQWLGDILAQYLQNILTIKMPSTASKIKYLLGAGADVSARHSLFGFSPFEILTNKLCASNLSAPDERQFIREIFFHASFEVLEDDNMLGALEKLLEYDRSDTIALILAHRPDLKLGFHRIRAHRLSGISAIERALDTERWEEVESLASLGLVNTPTVDGKTLLWRAIESKSDAWVLHLLRLGADPDIGPFQMTHCIESPSFVATCYPLEAALWLCRTRVCLELLRHKPNLDSHGGLPIGIAQETGNCILAARLREISDWLERQRQPDHKGTNEHDRTALLIACKMLSHNNPDEPPGLPKCSYLPNLPWGWKSELEKIIHRLALDGDAEYVNAQDSEKKTALHYLTETKDICPQRPNNLINVILSRGADPNLRDCRGETPLWLAIRNAASISLVIQPLLEAGAVTTRARSRGCSILKEAMIAYSDTNNLQMISLVRSLLQAGADPRDPRALAFPDPSLVSLAAKRGMKYLVKDFKQRTRELNALSRG